MTTMRLAATRVSVRQAEGGAMAIEIGITMPSSSIRNSRMGPSLLSSRTFKIAITRNRVARCSMCRSKMMFWVAGNNPVIGTSM